METSKLTVRENACIIREKSLDYISAPQGLGYEFYHSMLLNRLAIAQIDGASGETDTYYNLLRKCIRISINLLTRGITKDDIICLCTSNHFNSCVPIISGLFLGVKVAPLDPSLSLDDTTYILNQIRPRIIFVSTDVIEMIEEALEDVGVECEIVVFGFCYGFTEIEEFLEPVKNEAKFKPLPVTDVKETAIILFSSGTAGPSKGICLSHQALMIQFINTISYWNLGQKIYFSNCTKERSETGLMTAINFATYQWMPAVALLCCSILTATARIICKTFESEVVWKLIDKYEISFMSCTSFEAVQFYKPGKPERVEGKSLKMLVTSGTALRKSDMLELRKLLPRCFITNAYIQNEASGLLTMFDVAKPGDIRDQYEEPTSCGKLIPGVTCKIIDPVTGKILGVNKAGELRYKADFIMNGYHKLDSSVALDSDGWIKTGDVGLYDEKHRFYVLDNLRDIFKWKCWHIVPSVLENVLKEHPAIKEAVVIGIPHEDENIGELAMGIVSLNKHMRRRVTEKDIENYANANLTKRQQLRGGLKIVRQIPLRPTGKPNREELIKLVFSEES